MADDGLAQSETVWPMPKFHFEVKWDGGAGAGMVSAFQEVSGLDLEAQPIEYRAGNSPVFSTIKMPGPPKYLNQQEKSALKKRSSPDLPHFIEFKAGDILPMLCH